jgi:hypothetical protein
VFRWNLCSEDAEESGHSDDDNDDNKEEMPSPLVGLGRKK